MKKKSLILKDGKILKFKNVLETLNFPISRVYLFGSRAKGIQNEDSDYDFLVLLSNIEDFELVKKYRREIVLKTHSEIPNTSFDILVRNLNEFESYKTQINNLYHEISQEGIEI